MNTHVFEFRWTDPSSMEFQGSRDKNFGRKKIKIGDAISLKINGEKHCAGSSREGDWQSCNLDVSGKKKCESCRAREGSFVYTAFDGFNSAMLNPDDLAKIGGEHWVYLALFDKNLIKIGVSKGERKTMRQVEQGSHFTLYIAKTDDGIQARQIETLIRKGGLADKIPASQKKGILLPEITEAEGKTILNEKYQAYKTELDNFADLKKYCLAETEFVSWRETYGLPTLETNPQNYHSVKLGMNESVSGKIVAIKGAFVVIDTGEEFVSICGKDLIGYEIDFTPIQPGLVMEAALQNALF